MSSPPTRLPLVIFVTAAAVALGALIPGRAVSAADSTQSALAQSSGPGPTVPPVPDGGLIQPGNLVHLGSFKVPQNVGPGERGLECGGTGLAFNPANNSLFIVGHPADQRTAEISVPRFGGTATVLQGLADPVEGKRVSDDSDAIGGQLVYNGRLYVTKFGYYDATHSQVASHMARPLELSEQGVVQGPFRIGKLGAGFYAGFMALVPAEWRARLGGPVLTGNCCLSIIGRTSYGPAAAAFDLDRLGVAQDAVSLVHYTADHQTLGEYGAPGKHPVFNGATRIRGLVFPERTSSVLFFGATGIGNYCYGFAPDCGAPGFDKGEHAYPYRGYVWAYDANELAAVKAGKKRPWNVRPYATWELALPNVGSDEIGGVAYDPATGRIFVSQRLADGERPVIHVYVVR